MNHSEAGWYPDVVERLFRAFEREHSLPTILAVIRYSAGQLRGSPEPAMPELLERLARQRLVELKTVAEGRGVGVTIVAVPDISGCGHG